MPSFRAPALAVRGLLVLLSWSTVQGCAGTSASDDDDTSGGVAGTTGGSGTTGGAGTAGGRAGAATGGSATTGGRAGAATGGSATAGRAGAATGGSATTGGRAGGSTGGATTTGGRAGGSTGGTTTTGGRAGSAGGSGTTGGSAGDGSEVDGVDCDTRKVMCKRALPECPEMQVPSVEDTCYGECVPIADCRCTEAEDCPLEEMYTCHRSAARCGPYVR